MEQITIGNSSLTTSRVGLGTWAIGGWMWGGTDEARSIATIRSVVERGVIICERLLSQRPRPLSRFENRRVYWSRRYRRLKLNSSEISRQAPKRWLMFTPPGVRAIASWRLSAKLLGQNELPGRIPLARRASPSHSPQSM